MLRAAIRQLRRVVDCDWMKSFGMSSLSQTRRQPRDSQTPCFEKPEMKRTRNCHSLTTTTSDKANATTAPSITMQSGRERSSKPIEEDRRNKKRDTKKNIITDSNFLNNFNFDFFNLNKENGMSSSDAAKDFLSQRASHSSKPVHQRPRFPEFL